MSRVKEHEEDTVAPASLSSSSNSSSSDAEDDAWRRKLESVCSALGLSHDIRTVALAYWDTCRSESSQSCAATLGVCVYVAAVETAPVKITHLLTELDVHVGEFFRMAQTLDIPNGVGRSLATLHKKFDVVDAIYKKFRTMYTEIFSESSRESAAAFPSEMAKACWTMFILAKEHGLQEGTDLVSAFHLLLCVIDHFARRRGPAASLREPYASAVGDAEPPAAESDGGAGIADDAAASGEGEHSYCQDSTGSATATTAAATTEPVVVVAPPLIALLCRHDNCNHEEVMSINTGCFLPFLSSLLASATDDLPQLPVLSQQYQDLYEQSRGIDERGFLIDDPTLVPVASNRPQATVSPVGNQEAMPVPHQTPIRTTMNTIQQLKLILNSASDEPSATLSNYFSRCAVNPRADIASKVEEVGALFRKNFVIATSAGCAGVARQRLSLAVRLYYRVMEALLKSEEERLNTQDFSKLLGIDNLHVPLLACALEVVMATYNSSWSDACEPLGSSEEGGGVSFPWVLRILPLHAYHFSKVLESFIRAEPSLTRDIIRHLQRCEELVLESLVWLPDSPLLDELRNCRDGGHPSTDGVTPDTPGGSGLGSLPQGYLSPIRRPAGSAAAPAADDPTAAPPLTASPLVPHRKSCTIILKKVFCLAHQRLSQLCQEVHLLPSHANQERLIWTLMEHTLHAEPDLMAGRHLDQIMMCAMYAICKVTNIDLNFKTIVTAYKGMAHAKQQTFKMVLIRENMYDSIIVFYNLVFMQRLKSNILQFVSPHPPTLSPIPAVALPPSPFRGSPLRVPGRSNFYVSPLRTPRGLLGVPLTPNSRLLVCIGETIGSPQFRRINAVISAGGRGVKRRLDTGGAAGNASGPHGAARPQSKRLLFDGAETEPAVDHLDGGGGIRPTNGSPDAHAANGRSSSIIERKASELAFAFQRTRKDGDNQDA